MELGPALSVITTTLHTTLMTSSPELLGRQPYNNGLYTPETPNLSSPSDVGISNLRSASPQVSSGGAFPGSSTGPTSVISNSFYTYTDPDAGKSYNQGLSNPVLATYSKSGGSFDPSSAAATPSAKPQSQLTSLDSSGLPSHGPSVMTSETSGGSTESAATSHSEATVSPQSRPSTVPSPTTGNTSSQTTTGSSSSSTTSSTTSSGLPAGLATSLSITYWPDPENTSSTHEWAIEVTYTIPSPTPDPPADTRPPPSCVPTSAITWADPASNSLADAQNNDPGEYSEKAIYPIIDNDEARSDLNFSIYAFCNTTDTWRVEGLAAQYINYPKPNPQYPYPAGCRKESPLFCSWTRVTDKNNHKAAGVETDFYNFIGALKFFRYKPGAKDAAGSPTDENCRHLLEDTVDNCFGAGKLYGGNISADDGWTLGWYPTAYNRALKDIDWCAVAGAHGC